MSKKNKEHTKCPKCGYRVALISACLYDVRVGFDQEPYKADVVEPVIVGGSDIDEIDISFSLSGHVCPNCGWIEYLQFDSNM